jgi:preprotein translocase subunit SecG
MDRLKQLIREPALLIDAFETLVVMVVALGLFSVSGDQQKILIALLIAVLAFAKGFLTTPFPVTVVPDLGRAALVAATAFGVFHISADQITIIVTFLGTAMTLVQRGMITPKNDPQVAVAGAGAGPVAGRTEEGAANVLVIVCVVLAVIFILALLIPGGLLR